MTDHKKVIQNFRQDLAKVHKDWELLLNESVPISDKKFLKKVADDIQQLSKDAAALEPIKELKEKAELVEFLLSTPWGAPFVGDMTLIDAANTFSEDNSDSDLKHLISRFIDYGHQIKTPLFQIFDEIASELDGEEG